MRAATTMNPPIAGVLEGDSAGARSCAGGRPPLPRGRRVAVATADCAGWGRRSGESGVGPSSTESAAAGAAGSVTGSEPEVGASATSVTVGGSSCRTATGTREGGGSSSSSSSSNRDGSKTDVRPMTTPRPSPVRRFAEAAPLTAPGSRWPDRRGLETTVAPPPESGHSVGRSGGSYALRRRLRPVPSA
jgi:hypothetical protein